MPSQITVGWVQRAREFGRYFLLVFRPWTSRPPAEPGGADPWGELIHFFRFLSSSGSCETLQVSLSFLAAHPLNAPAVSCPDLMILENDIEEHGNAAEEPGISNFDISNFDMVDADVPPTPPPDPHHISNPSSIPIRPDPDKMASLEGVASTLGVSLPSGYGSILRQLKLIRACLTLSGAPPQCLEHLCYQDQWSRNMLVESFVHLPWILQRDVAERLADPTIAFSTVSHSLDRMYGVCRPQGVQRPMTGDGVLDVDLILEEHDVWIASAALYLQCTARSNEDIEKRIFGVKKSDTDEWYEYFLRDNGAFMRYHFPSLSSPSI
jgi:hypothetical protein